MFRLQQKYTIIITLLLISLLSGLAPSLCIAAHPYSSNAGPETYYSQEGPVSQNSLLTPSLMNYGVSSYACDPRESRRMNAPETAAVLFRSGSLPLISSERRGTCCENRLYSYVSLRRHGFAYARSDEDPFPALSR